MDRWEREGLRSANSGMRNQLDHILDVFERQQARLSEVYQQLESARTQASSPDQSVQVTVDASGVLTDLRLDPVAMRRSAEQLSRSIVDAVQAAARHARQQSETLTGPVSDDLDAMPDFPDLVPEAPGLRDVRAFLRGGKDDTSA
ncbi:YbaB/EbfC family nucleoid-associated protein [Nocardia blacklockiae]|uniref:YbaB/EbfC family nucleoid-associated protein n=1 Tax=Nocardia blacklockiae TaxID=480036 RepID=UPI0018941A8C|nr:YbaB/EbfC family nucleoid-associated protein [Nocardia blacklockiae]MBF6174735.1 YbaB/EbfC family nucleoid-associated protein [Nocardia blacklockiae]